MAPSAPSQIYLTVGPPVAPSAPSQISGVQPQVVYDSGVAIQTQIQTHIPLIPVGGADPGFFFSVGSGGGGGGA